MRVPHYPRCERTQQENRTHSLGSDPPLAARCSKVRTGPSMTMLSGPVRQDAAKRLMAAESPDYQFSVSQRMTAIRPS